MEKKLTVIFKKDDAEFHYHAKRDDLLTVEQIQGEKRKIVYLYGRDSMDRMNDMLNFARKLDRDKYSDLMNFILTWEMHLKEERQPQSRFRFRL